MKPLFGKGYCVTVDNYYTSPQLADALVMNQTDTYGALHMNRKEVPEELKRKKLQHFRGKVKYSSLERQKGCCNAINHSQPSHA